jgi:Uma2 family endonuclease
MRLLDGYVQERNLGQVCVGPVAVVLDRDAGLVVSPDIIFTSNERLGMIDQRVWGAPDLVVEVASPRTAKRDGTTKRDWYRQYGVKECWLVYPMEERIEVVDLATSERESFSGKTPIASHVLPEFAIAAGRCF